MKKIKLGELNIQSFVTVINKNEIETIVGAYDTEVCSDDLHTFCPKDIHTSTPVKKAPVKPPVKQMWTQGGFLCSLLIGNTYCANNNTQP